MKDVAAWLWVGILTAFIVVSAVNLSFRDWVINLGVGYLFGFAIGYLFADTMEG